MTPEQREELKRSAQDILDVNGVKMTLDQYFGARLEFEKLSTPEVVLSLIAQVEALTVPADYFAPVVLNPTCACAKCNPNAAGRMMILCATCGNKRCPHATDHRLACTDSNEPGQPGSSYAPTIPAMPGTKEGA